MNAAELPPPLVIPDRAAWRAWLEEHEDQPGGVWLLLAKKDSAAPTALTYEQALEEALCCGWIDGQRRRHDEHAFRQLFTPRRARSLWSQRNVQIIARLEAEGRMRERGRAEVERARADGRWERAYAGPATAAVPDDLAAALAASPAAAEAFAQLTRSARYSALHPILTAPNDTVRTRRIGALVTTLKSSGAELPGDPPSSPGPAPRENGS